MNQFEKCKKRWLEEHNCKTEKHTEELERVKRLLIDQENYGNAFKFPTLSLVTLIKHLFKPNETKSEWKCPCCGSTDMTCLSVYDGGYFYNVWECLCGYEATKER